MAQNTPKGSGKQSIASKIMIGFGAFLTAGFGIGYVTTYPDPTASSQVVAFLATFLCIGIAILTAGLIVREKHRESKRQTFLTL